MLLALAERTLATPRFRADLDSMAAENGSRRSHAIRMKSLTNRFVAKQKSLAAARLLLKNATDAKWNKELVRGSTGNDADLTDHRRTRGLRRAGCAAECEHCRDDFSDPRSIFERSLAGLRFDLALLALTWMEESTTR